MLDEKCKEIITKSNTMLVPWWIISAWCYEDGTPIISDGLFDSLAIQLDQMWDFIDHPHKKLLDRSILKSSIAINGKWPNMAIGSAKLLQKELSTRKQN